MRPLKKDQQTHRSRGRHCDQLSNLLPDLAISTKIDNELRNRGIRMPIMATGAGVPQPFMTA